MGYPEFLNIRPYMSQSSGEPVTYSLYAVLVHSGYSCHAGHYYCYVKVSCGPHGHRCLCSSREAVLWGPLGMSGKPHWVDCAYPCRLTQASSGQWYQMNDALVHASSVQAVLNQQAYVLFYLR